MPVTPPAETKNEDAKRAYMDALIQVIPWAGGSISSVLAHYWPYAGEKEMARTVGDLCRLVNRLEQELMPVKENLELSPRLTALAVLVAREFCTLGDHDLTSPLGTKEIFDRFVDIPREEIEDAIMELIKQGLFMEHRTMRSRFEYVSREPNLFFMFDPDVHGWLPAVDAYQAGQLMLENSEFCTSEKLDKHLGWPRRRLNAALLFLQTAIFEENHYGKTLQTDYPSRWWHPGPEERYELRQLKQKLSSLAPEELASA